MFNLGLNYLDILLNFFSKYTKLTLWYFVKDDQEEIQLEYESIDVVIPLIEKDLETFHVCVSSLKEYSLNPIRNIYVISPTQLGIKKNIENSPLIYIPEDQITKLTSKEISHFLESSKMVGWLKQQLIKLNIDSIDGILPNVLIIDSDTILCKNQYFIADGRTVVKFSDEYHLKYKIANKYLLNTFSTRFVSFISHHQIFNISHLKNLREIVETNTKLPFNLAFLEAYKRYGLVSEYELYAQYVLSFYPTIFKVKYWFNINHKISSPVETISAKALSYSLHNYNYT
jgi:hypothetical protein